MNRGKKVEREILYLFIFSLTSTRPIALKPYFEVVLYYKKETLQGKTQQIEFIGGKVTDGATFVYFQGKSGQTPHVLSPFWGLPPVILFLLINHQW